MVLEHMALQSASLPTAVLVTATGAVRWGHGVGARGTRVGELCFTTGATGYQETLTDPSFARQIITFTSPHIGNVGVNAQDDESRRVHALGCVMRGRPTPPSNHRAEEDFSAWLERQNVVGVCGLDTRALTRSIRQGGAVAAALWHGTAEEASTLDVDSLRQLAQRWPGLAGMDLAKTVSEARGEAWTEPAWEQPAPPAGAHVVVIDYGAKRAILRRLVSCGLRVTCVSATASADEILALRPDGVLLSNGPGDPASTAVYAAPAIRRLLEAELPIFGICLGHQLLAIALSGSTEKMRFGHRGANHPVQRPDGRVEITSQNHGFSVVDGSLPPGVEATHRSLFDGSVEGLRLRGAPVFSVQYHPEASPGPHDAIDLFGQFADLVLRRREAVAAVVGAPAGAEGPGPD